MEFFIMNLLSGSASGSSSSASTAADNGWLSWILIGVLVVAFVVMMIFSSRSNKKRQQEQEAAINAIRPGNKVKTIGGVCGIVVEVNDEENTFVIETGNETNGKCYLKFDKGAIYQTDAKVEKTDDKKSKGDKKDETEKDDSAKPEESAPADGAEDFPETTEKK